MKVETKFKLAAVCVFIVMLFVAALPYETTVTTRLTVNRLEHAVVREEEFERLLDFLRDAETGQRGFVITGKESYLKPYYAALGQMPVLRQTLLEQSPAAADRKAVEEIFSLVDLKLEELAETIALRRSKGFAGVEPVVSSDRGKQYMDRLRDLISRQLTSLSAQRIALRADMEHNWSRSLGTGIGVTLVNLALLASLMVLMLRVMKARQATSDQLQAASNELAASNAIITQRNDQMEISAEMLQALGSIASLQETSRIITIYCAKLFPELSGVLYLHRNSRDLLEAQASWGKPSAIADPLDPGDCWALQRGHAHHTRGPQDLCCNHYAASGVLSGRLCLPLVTQGEVVGLLCLEGLAADTAAFQHQQGLLDRTAEQIALALSNVKLRETLRRQSIVDPLTGLFNRRYLDETLKRELSRAERKKLPLSLIVLDLDHFKRINDTFGHDAGDSLLKGVAQQVTGNIRDSDLACRFGGEELVLILPECDAGIAVQRAETIRRAIAALDVRHGGRTLGSATASFGVAQFPQDGGDAAALLQAADQAMYRAKQAGRNCVMTAAEPG